MRPIIKAENLSKLYRIGAQQAPYSTLRDSITNALRAPLGWIRRNGNREANTIWALRDVNFEIKPGEVVGVIGRNGAGKSTLFKILSRITEPTNGRVDIYGRVGSMLEVGTGFHLELSGRENIYVNGAILGMRRSEINRKFDEIVSFAEIENFIDTPVKHYSSGMHMRLAFAVAAHLEPEILIVDEVLAVGDMEFQKRCLGKMSEVGNQGRTVLFVSHNMQAIAQLTRRCIVMDRGQCVFDGASSEAISAYNKLQPNAAVKGHNYRAESNLGTNYLAWAKVNASEGKGLHRWGRPISFEFGLRIKHPQRSLCFSFQILNELQQPVCHFWLFDGEIPFRKRDGEFTLKCNIPKFRLYMGEYTLRTWISEGTGRVVHENIDEICPFEVTMDGIVRSEFEWQAGHCVYLEDAVWETKERSMTAGAL